jgi:hypothetical protein
MSELAKIDPVADPSQSGLAIRSMDDLSRMSKMLASSGYFADAKDAAQCGVKVLAGMEMGVKAFAAMTGIHVIQGKPAAGSGLMAAAIKKHPNYNYRVLELSETVCKIQFYENGEKCGVSEFTAAEALAAGTKNMNKFPKNMLFARAISNGVRFYCPDVFEVSVYTPEELGANVDGDGNVIDVQPQTNYIVQENEPMHAVGDENKDRFRNLTKELGIKASQVKELAQEMSLSTNVADLTTEETVRLEDAVREKFKPVAVSEIIEKSEVTELQLA